LRDARARREGVKGGVRAMEVIVMKVVGKEGSAVVAGVIGAGIGPLAGNGLDEAFGFAVGLRAIGFGEEMLEAEELAGSGEGFGAIGGAAIGQDLLDVDAMSGVEGEGLVEGEEDALSAFVWEETSEGEAGVIVDGDVETFDPGAGVALGAIAGGADAWAREATELLDIEVEKLAGEVAFVTPGRRLGRFQGREPIEVMATQDARESGLGDGQDHQDLSIGTALAAEGEDLGFELGAGLARLGKRSGGMIVQALGEARLLGAGEPAAHRLLADPESERSGAQGEAKLRVLESHLSASQRSESGISVHVECAQKRWVES